MAKKYGGSWDQWRLIYISIGQTDLDGPACLRRGRAPRRARADPRSKCVIPFWVYSTRPWRQDLPASQARVPPRPGPQQLRARQAVILKTPSGANRFSVSPEELEALTHTEADRASDRVLSQYGFYFTTRARQRASCRVPFPSCIRSHPGAHNRYTRRAVNCQSCQTTDSSSEVHP